MESLPLWDFHDFIVVQQVLKFRLIILRKSVLFIISVWFVSFGQNIECQEQVIYVYKIISFLYSFRKNAFPTKINRVGKSCNFDLIKKVACLNLTDSFRQHSTINIRQNMRQTTKKKGSNNNIAHELARVHP